MCPSCGLGNERGIAEDNRSSVHCGANLEPAIAPAPGIPTETREPSRGAGPQPPLEQPYGGQPYPSPPGLLSYGGTGPPSPYPPTYHPGVYDKPERTPYIDIRNLFKLLFHPKEAFEDLYDHTGSSQGIVLALTFILLSAGISMFMMFAVLGTLEVPEEATSVPGGSGSVTHSVIDAILGIVLFFVSAYLVFTFLKSRGRRASKDKTIGMMGYARFPMFIIGLIIAIAMPFLIDSMDLEALENEDPDAESEAPQSILGGLSILAGLSGVGLVWSIWVNSHAQSVANDASLEKAAVSILITWVIVGIISYVVGLIVATQIISS